MTRYGCSECLNVSFTRKSSARRHIESKHLGAAIIMDFKGYPVKYKSDRVHNPYSPLRNTASPQNGGTRDVHPITTPADVVYSEEYLRELARLSARETFEMSKENADLLELQIIDALKGYNNAKAGVGSSLLEKENYLKEKQRLYLSLWRAQLSLAQSNNSKRQSSSGERQNDKAAGP